MCFIFGSGLSCTLWSTIHSSLNAINNIAVICFCILSLRTFKMRITFTYGQFVPSLEGWRLTLSQDLLSQSLQSSVLAGLKPRRSVVLSKVQSFICLKKDTGLNPLGSSLHCSEHSTICLLTGNSSFRMASRQGHWTSQLSGFETAVSQNGQCPNWA